MLGWQKSSKDEAKQEIANVLDIDKGLIRTKEDYFTLNENYDAIFLDADFDKIVSLAVKYKLKFHRFQFQKCEYNSAKITLKELEFSGCRFNGNVMLKNLQIKQIRFVYCTLYKDAVFADCDIDKLVLK